MAARPHYDERPVPNAMPDTPESAVTVSRSGVVTTVVLSRPEVRNAVDGRAAQQLADAFRDFDADDEAAVAVLYGAGGTFCAGADLKAMGTGRGNRLTADGDGPMGPTRMRMGKPVIAAIEGFAVAGGLELALWCDLRVVAEDAVLGVFCRRWGVPLIDGGTARLAPIVGLGRAMDLILTGREVGAEEALQIGLASRVVAPGETLASAQALAAQLAALPQRCLRSDRLSLLEAADDPARALANEFARGLEVIGSGETLEGASRFAAGAGRHGRPESMQ